MVNVTTPAPGFAPGGLTPVKAPSLLTPLDPEKAKKFEETKKVLQQTLDALKNSDNEIGKQRKAMAAQKVARIKEMIKALKQMAVAADPKTIARMAARLAKDLAAALKEYAAAGGTSTEITVSSGNVPTRAAAPENAAPEAAADTASADAEAMADMPDEAMPAAEEKPAAASPFKAYEQAQNRSNDAEERKTIRKKDDDGPFLRDAKETLEELRFLIKLQRARYGSSEMFKKDDVTKAEDALKEADKAFQTLTKAMASVSISA